MPQDYFPSDQVPRALSLLAQRSGDLAPPIRQPLPPLRRMIHDANPEQAISDVQLLGEDRLIPDRVAPRAIGRPRGVCSAGLPVGSGRDSRTAVFRRYGSYQGDRHSHGARRCAKQRPGHVPAPGVVLGAAGIAIAVPPPSAARGRTRLCSFEWSQGGRQGGAQPIVVPVTTPLSGGWPRGCGPRPSTRPSPFGRNSPCNPLNRRRQEVEPFGRLRLISMGIAPKVFSDYRNAFAEFAQKVGQARALMTASNPDWQAIDAALLELEKARVKYNCRRDIWRRSFRPMRRRYTIRSRT